MSDPFDTQRMAEELHVANERNATAIAALEARMDGTEQRLSRTETAIERLTEGVAVLREAVAKVATKDDIIKLSDKIEEKFGQELRDARNSIPGKYAAWTGVGMLILTLVSLIVSVMHHA